MVRSLLGPQDTKERTRPRIDLFAKSSERKFTALHIAAVNDRNHAITAMLEEIPHQDAVKLLREPNVGRPHIPTRRTCVSVCTDGGKTVVVTNTGCKLFGVCLARMQGSGYTALHLAALGGLTEVIRTLLAAGADVLGTSEV